MMYNNIQSTVINNGTTCEYFTLQRGVRQGCPMSAYLFIIALEILAHSIRSNELITGFKIGKKEIKLSMLADDLTCILGNVKSVKYILETLDKFRSCAGLSANIEKTQAKYIGSLTKWDYYPHGLSWIKKPLETLGIVLTNSDAQNYSSNFELRIKKLKTLLDIWKQRNLSIKGKITILNNLALSSLIYVSSIIDTPTRAINEINNLIKNFIWEGKNSKISKKTLVQNIENGGLKLCDFDIKIKALKISWINRLLDETEANWKILPKFYFGDYDLGVYFNAHQKTIKKSTIPTFYKDIHNVWMSNFKKDPITTKDLREESLWLNKNITCKRNTMYWENWVKHGITKIGHILNENGQFYSYEEIKQKYDIPCNFINMLTLRQSIPYKWRQMINDKSNLIKITDTHPNIKLNTTEMYLPLTKMKCKDLYWHMIQQHTHKPSAMEQWYKSNPLLKEANSEAWIRIFKMPFKIIRETKLQSFQYKIVHRTIACNKWLANIKIRCS